MGISNIIYLLGGLGLFLFGMKYMSDGINQVAGNKMKNLLEKLTSNRFKGFFLGVIVTVIIQSSSATTVMLMGFLNAGIMTLAQATGVIIGANIGTTITAVLIALDVSAIAPFCIFIGAVMALFSKKLTQKYIGQIILGFGILFFGLKTMSGENAMGVLQTSVGFQNFITHVNNPFLGLVIGIIMCSVLQSSSASIGVLQMLALNGLMPLNFAIYLIIGINVGSAMPLFLSSIGAKTNAKRAAMVYFIFDFVGMLIFTPLALFTPFDRWVEAVSADGSVQVAAAHIIFKVVTAVVLLPFVPAVVRVSEKLIPAKEHESERRFTYIDTKVLDNPMATSQEVVAEVNRMAQVVRKNIALTGEAFFNCDTTHEREILDNEELINWLNHSISDFLVNITSHELNADVSERIVRVLRTITDLERIGDHALNVLERTKEAKENSLNFSEEALVEFKDVYDDVLVLFDRSVDAFINGRLTDSEAHELHTLEDGIDKKTNQAQDNHVNRLREKKCSTASGVVFTKVLQDLERMGDHAYNVAWAARRDKKLIHSIR
ncbi:MAG: Na/Pi cotransporter family protein [Ruminococcaceae bacterium]|nr:Na/Pi cotransporter family protein [Oscillospiraceae bacterium]